MGYRIEYTGEDRPVRRRGKWAAGLVFLLLAAIISCWFCAPFLREGAYRIYCFVRTLSGALEDTAASLKDGAALGDAVAAFWDEMRAYGTMQ